MNINVQLHLEDVLKMFYSDECSSDELLIFTNKESECLAVFAYVLHFYAKDFGKHENDTWHIENYENFKTMSARINNKWIAVQDIERIGKSMMLDENIINSSWVFDMTFLTIFDDDDEEADFENTIDWKNEIEV